MKKIALILFATVILASKMANGQGAKTLEKDRNTPLVNHIIVFDFDTKLWQYDSIKSKYKKGKYYFLIPYKSQPVIKVKNIPSSYTVEIESSLFDITLQTEGEKSAGTEETKQKIQNKIDTINQISDQIRSSEEAKNKILKMLPKDSKYLAIDNSYNKEKDSLYILLNQALAEKRALSAQLSLIREKEKKTVKTQTMKMVDSDEVEYILTIKDSTKNIIHKTTAYAKIYGGLKIDLSTGVLFHNLLDASYHFEDGTNNQSGIVKDKTNGTVKPLFPVLLTHVYWRSKKFISPGLSLGLGIDDTGKAGYYFGPAMLLGDRQRAVISTGLAFRPTDTLKGKYVVGQMIDNNAKPEVTDLVESVYKAGFFISVTYNLTAKVEKRK